MTSSAGGPLGAMPRGLPKRVEQHKRDLAQRAEEIRQTIKERDQAIREAWDDGLPATIIAEAAGLTRQRVYQITGQP